MNTKHSFPVAVLLVCLLAGSDRATGQVPSKPPGPAMGPKNAQSSIKGDRAFRMRQLVDRQVQAWEKQDFGIAAGDWLPTAELISPGGRAAVSGLPGAISGYFKQFRDLHVTVKNVFASADGTKLAIEWDWDVTRIRDGARQTTHDAIIVDLRGEKIASWREYFDFGDSVDAHP
jgi:ketosteroid isomerase-like protein